MWIVTREAATGVVRTAMPYIYAWLVVQIPYIESLNVDQAVLVPIVGTLLYTAIRWVAEKVPSVGYLLVFNTKPTY